MDGSLRSGLVQFINRKFYSYPNISILAEDIVQEAYIRLISSRQYNDSKENFGYLSVICIRIAYRQFMAQSQTSKELCLDVPDSILIQETDFVQEILEAEDVRVILQSLETLRQIEKIILTQRYYGDLSFAQIAEENHLNLNTVLSHHRRALAKLRPQLTQQLELGKEHLYE